MAHAPLFNTSTSDDFLSRHHVYEMRVYAKISRPNLQRLRELRHNTGRTCEPFNPQNYIHERYFKRHPLQRRYDLDIS